MTEFASLPPVTSDGLQPTVAVVAKAVADRADQLVDVLEDADPTRMSRKVFVSAWDTPLGLTRIFLLDRADGRIARLGRRRGGVDA